MVESRSQEPQALFPRNGTRLTLFAGLAFMLISSGVQWIIGRPFALTSLSAQDDEGYMLVLLHLSADGHALYSQMYSQYGPMFHWIWNALFSVLDLEYTLSTGRLVTVACWVVASLGFGVATQ